MTKKHKLKSECTPDEWAAYLQYHRERRAQNVERERELQRKYNALPEVKARRKAWDAQPHIAERRKASNQTPEAKALDRERRKAHREKFPESHAKRLAKQRQMRTGFEPDLIQQLLAFQKHSCAICKRPFGKGHTMRADHCHDSASPRGLLCHPCNVAEGLLKRLGISPEEFAERLTKYLANPPAKQLAEHD